MKFPDVNEKAWYAQYIEKASEAGIMIGDDQGNFRPSDHLTRAEAAAIVSRLLDIINKTQD